MIHITNKKVDIDGKVEYKEGYSGKKETDFVVKMRHKESRYGRDF